jgi:hypothetical protein
VVDASLLPRSATASARLALAWSNHRLLLWNTGTRRPRQHAAPSRGRGGKRPGHRAWRFEHRAGLWIFDDQRRLASAGLYTTPEPPVGELLTTARESHGRTTARLSGTPHDNAYEST